MSRRDSGARLKDRDSPKQGVGLGGGRAHDSAESQGRHCISESGIGWRGH